MRPPRPLWPLWALWALWVPAVGGGPCVGQRLELWGPGGVVTDGPGNYSVSGSCQWLLHAPSPGLSLVLTFSSLDTECGFDLVSVFDGPSPRAPRLGSFSGSQAPPPIQATSGQLLLQLFSDPNYNRGGFVASFRAWPCPGGCWGRGRCDARGRCHCGPEWSGADCSQPRCSAVCRAPMGACNELSGLCECRPGFVGRGCELELGRPGGGGRWYPLSQAQPHFPPRAAAAGAFLPHTGALYIFGGLDLNSVLGDLVLYNLSTNQWQRLSLSPQPAPRHSHAAARWRQSLVLMGGELAGGALANDVWSFEPGGRGWRELRPLPGGEARAPPGLAAHAVAVVDDWLYVFGGRTPQDLFSSGLFRFPLRGGRWERVEPWGGKAPAAAGHSLLFHPPSRALLLYGGHRPASARFSSRVNRTHLFHVDRRHWVALRERAGTAGPRERAFHSATLLGDYMVVYGGHVHAHYQEEKCYEDGVFFYHLGCHQWVTPQELQAGDPEAPSPAAPPPAGPLWSRGRGAGGRGAPGGGGVQREPPR